MLPSNILRIARIFSLNTQLVKYPRVLSIKPINKVYVFVTKLKCYWLAFFIIYASYALLKKGNNHVRVEELRNNTPINYQSIS